MERTQHKILIVEDEPISSRVLKNCLESAGFVVEEAENGVIALEQLKNAPDAFSVIVMDCIMPQMSGLKLMEILKKTPHLDQIPIIMLTVLDDQEDVLEAVRAGAFDYLTKPVDEKILIEMIEAAISKTLN